MSHLPITFISDLGTADGSVGIIHSVIRSASKAPIVDLTHEITPFAIAEGAYALARSVDYLQAGVVLAVVDPTDARPVVIEVGGGQSYLVGPDNGLLAPAVAMVGGATAAYEIVPSQTATDERHSETHERHPELDSGSKSRDVLAPAVARISVGISPTEFCKSIDVATLTPQLMPVAEQSQDGSVDAQVLWIDRFGNVHLNVDAGLLNPETAAFRFTVGDLSSEISKTSDSEIHLAPDSYGLFSLMKPRGSAAEALGITVGMHVQITPIDGETQPVGSPVEFKS